MNQYLIEKLKYQIMKSINEARIKRTIPPKIWATVSSVISKKYRADKGASAKPVGDIDTLLQKYVVALILFKEDCPTTTADMMKCQVFPQWASALLKNGVAIWQVVKLYNENTGADIPIPGQIPVIQDEEPVTDTVPVEPEPVIAEPASIIREPEPAEQIEPENGYKYKAELRTTIPGRPGEYRSKILDYGIVPYDKNMDTVWGSMIAKYNSMKYKTKCRSGIIDINLYIEIIDPETKLGYAGIIRREGVFKEVTPNS